MDNQVGIDLQDWSVHKSSFKKSPISLIKEIADKMCIPCQFDLLENYDITPNGVFKYRLTLGGYQTVADGPSKKRAKNQVALNMLKLIKKHNPFLPKNEFKQIDFENRVDVCKNIKVNFVGPLYNLCANKNLAKPVYKLVREKGKPHNKLYTFSCHVAQMIEKATDKNKRQAKNLTAAQMFEKLKSMECQGSMNPAQEQYDTIKTLDNIEINKFQVQQSINATITDKKMDNEVGLDLQDWSVRERSYKKSPISMIKEIAEKINIPCQYELLDNYDLTPNNVFKYRLTLGDYQTVADGPSKKSAKHQVALNMIKQIKKHNPLLSGTEFNQIDFGNQVDDCNKIDANCVDRLAKACTIKNLVEPVYKQVCEDAVKQEAQMIDIATCKTKTEDENLTAHQMLGKLESMEFHRSMTPEQENNDPIKNLEDIEIDKNQGKQSINAVITEKKNDNPAQTASIYSSRLYKVCKTENVENGDPSQSLYTKLDNPTRMDFESGSPLYTFCSIDHY